MEDSCSLWKTNFKISFKAAAKSDGNGKEVMDRRRHGGFVFSLEDELQDASYKAAAKNEGNGKEALGRRHDQHQEAVIISDSEIAKPLLEWTKMRTLPREMKRNS